MSLGISDSSSGLGKSSDYIPYKSTVELGAEKKIADVKAKLNVLSKLDKVNVKFENGFLKRKARVENYEDFIEELYVKGLRREEIYFALKDLEKIAEGELKEKIRALRKEVGKKEGIDKKHVKIMGYLLAGAVLAASGIVGCWYFSQDRQKPEIKKLDYKDRVAKGEEQEFVALINEKNPAQTASLKLNGSSIDVPLFQDFKNGSILYKTSFDPASISTREGKLIGEFVVKDQNGNEAKSSLNFLVNLEAPKIQDVKIEKLEFGKYRVSALIEEQNLKEAYLQLLNSTKIPLVRTDSKYSANLSTKADLDFYVKAEDAFNLSSSLAGKIRITDRDKFESWLPPEFDKALALSLFDASPLVQDLFKKNELSALTSLLKVAQLNGSSIPKNLAYLVSDQIWRDDSVKDKAELASKSFDLILNKLGVKGLKRIDSVWLLDNASLLGFRDLEGLRKALEFSESSNISLNFEKRLAHSALADTGYYFPEIFKYPYEAKYLAIQVADTIYFVECVDGLNFSISDLKGKDYVWNGLILPYCKWRFERLENKSFESLDYKFKEGELAKLAEWADASVVDVAARSLYPFEELMDHDLLGFDSTRFFHDRKILQALERGIRNMSFNTTIKNSPFGYIYDLLESDVEKIYDLLERHIVIVEDRNERYIRAYFGFWSFPPHDIWINSSSFWKMKVGEYYQETPESRALIEQDPETTIIRGYPPALSICSIPVNSHFYLAGQSDPYVSKIIGAMQNRAVVVLSAPYPTSPDGVHDEPFIVGKDGKLIGFWYKLDKFLDDYNPEKNPRANDYWKTNKPWIRVEIVSDLNSKKFEYQDLSKVLNP
jgi:hypothetical protein